MNSKILMAGVAVLTLGVIAVVAIRHSAVSQAPKSGARSAAITGKNKDGTVFKKAVQPPVVPVSVKQTGEVKKIERGIGVKEDQTLEPAINHEPFQQSQAVSAVAPFAASSQAHAGFTDGTPTQGVNAPRQEAVSNAPSPMGIVPNALPSFEPVVNGTGPAPQVQDTASTEANNSQTIKAMAVPRAAQVVQNKVGPAASPKASTAQLPVFSPITSKTGPVAVNG